MAIRCGATPPKARATSSRFVLSPQTSRCLPSSQTSPGRVTGSTAWRSGPRSRRLRLHGQRPPRPIRLRGGLSHLGRRARGEQSVRDHDAGLLGELFRRAARTDFRLGRGPSGFVLSSAHVPRQPRRSSTASPFALSVVVASSIVEIVFPAYKKGGRREIGGGAPGRRGSWDVPS